MSGQVRLLQDDDVISTGSSALMFQCTFKVSEFLTIMQSKLEEEQLLGEGLECELLSPGQQWQRGKIKIRIEFEPMSGEEVPGSSLTENTGVEPVVVNGSTTNSSTDVNTTSNGSVNSDNSSVTEPQLMIPPIWTEDNSAAPQPLPITQTSSVGMWT